ncbi:hypothetical protein ANN_02349 [Periplaneta americana]|uniref:Reverse transcriptase domain-containing protein n=1 Tax=Periplaneta americana TaxID=6978 RepID=A0ABQ8U078_PERAM|nr:hypothetical protein ANN_02349 [Periplaneta americana]
MTLDCSSSSSKRSDANHFFICKKRRGAEFKYLGAKVTNINDTREEIKHRINMGNACYYSVEKLLSSSLLSKNLKVRIYKTVILPVVLYGCETWTLTLREEHRLRVFEHKVLRKICGAKRDEVTGEWRKLHNTELHALYSSPDIIRNIKSRRLRWAGERLSVAKRVEQQVNITKFNILKLKDEETKQNYQVEISNRFATLESSDEVEKELDVNRVWENIRDSIKIAAEQSIGYYETKKKKPWFDEDSCMVVERRKQAKLKFLQDSVEEKRDNYFNERREASRTIRNKKRGYLKEKLNEVETNSKNKNIRDLYKGIKEFKNGYQPRVNVIKDENGDLLADSPSILNRWKNYFAQLLNVHRPNRNDRDEIEIQTAEPFIPEPTLSEVEIAIENLKKYKSPGIDQIPAELIQEGGSALYSEIYKLVLAIWEKEIVLEQWKESIIVPIFKKGDKTNCGNFRGISLLLTSYKMLSNILLRRLTPYVDEIIGDHQCGFRRNRSTIDQIFCIRQIMEKKMGV